MQPTVVTFASQTGTNITPVLSGLPFLPKYARFIVGQKNSTGEAFVHKSEGLYDGTSTICHSIFWDATGGKTARFTDRVINHINRVGGTLTDVIVADAVAFSEPTPGDFEMTINFPTSVSGYRIDVELFP